MSVIEGFRGTEGRGGHPWPEQRPGSGPEDCSCTASGASRAAAAARRSLSAPSRGPPGLRHAPPRPAFCLLYLANNWASAPRAVFPLDEPLIIPRPRS